MTNEKWVNAPISKIVEAIMKAVKKVPTCSHGINFLGDIASDTFLRQYITEALASLGGEGNNEITPPRIFKWLQEQNYQKEYGEQEYMMYYDVDMPRIINEAIKHFAPNPSECEVLMPKISNATIVSKQYCQNCGEPVTKIDMK